jgi:hypothetical protein
MLNVFNRFACLFLLQSGKAALCFSFQSSENQHARSKVFLRATLLESILDEPATSLKAKLLQLGASYDRGFGASSSARQEVLGVIDGLEAVNPETNATRGIAGDEPSPLEGSWRLIWTTAQDVLVLAASPLSTVGAIYQVFAPPVVTNIIDLLPRAQALFPPSLLPQSLLRAEVTTRASPRRDKMNRVGLVFEAVKLKPIEVFGYDAGQFPPLAFDLPKIPGTDLESSPGYFDVTYLDSELLIIRQNAPGGLFVLAKVDGNDP